MRRLIETVKQLKVASKSYRLRPVTAAKSLVSSHDVATVRASFIAALPAKSKHGLSTKKYVKKPANKENR